MIAILLQTYLIIVLIAFAVGILATFYNRPAPLYIKFLPWFMLLVFVQEKIAFDTARRYGNNHNVCNIFLLTNVLFYSFILYYLLKKPAVKKWLLYAAAFFLLTGIPLIFFIQGINYFNSIVYFTGGLTLSIFSGYHLFGMFQEPDHSKPLRMPQFWIASGILFYHCSTMPLILPWPLLLHCTPYELKVLHIVLTLMYCISYVIFIIGFVFYWRLHRAIVPVENR